jgi:uncharacterized protein DUF4261
VNVERRMLVGALVVCLMTASGRPGAADQSANNGNVDLAFVLLSAPRVPKPEAIERAFASFALPGQTLRHASGKAATKRGGVDVLQLELGDGRVAFVALMPVAIPNHEADDAARFSVSGLGGRWKLPPHKAHLVVSMPGAPSTAATLSAFTSVVAAVVEASPAVGVYCGAARATHDPKFFTEIARERDAKARLALWSGVSIAREPDGRFSVLSLGMKQFALPDLLLVAAPSKSEDAISMLFDLLDIVIERGSALPEGDTVGPSANERWPVHYVPSPIDPKLKVWRVEMK